MTTIYEKTPWTKGAYTAYLSPWGVGSLQYGTDYADSMTFDPSTFPNNIMIRWGYPANPSPYAIYNFDAIDFGNYNHTTPQTHVATTQVKNIGTLTQTQDLVLGGSHASQANYDVLTDIFLTSKAGDSSTKVFEVEVLLHTPKFSSDWVNHTLSQIGTFTGSGHTWQVAIGYGAVPAIVFTPTDRADVLHGNVDIKAMLDYLVAHGTITGNEYFNGLGMGVEVHQGGAQLAITDFSVNYGVKSAATASAGTAEPSTGTSGGTSAPASTAPVTTLSDALQTTSNGVTTTVIKGHTGAGSTVTLSDYGNHLSNKIVADSHGDFSFTTTKISANAIHDLTATATNTAGKVGAESNSLQLGTPGGGMYDKGDGTVFVGSKGTDYYIGGGANDQFVFHSNFGNDVVQTFNPGATKSSSTHDTLVFDHTMSALAGITTDAGLASYVLAHAADMHGGTQITIGNDSIALLNVSKSQLATHDFHLI